MFNFLTVSQHYSAALSLRKSSVHDSKPEFIDSTYIEYLIFGLFKIDILNYIKIKAILAKDLHIQPSEVEAMPAWEYELFMRELNNAIKEDNKRNEDEQEKAGYNDAKKMASQSNVERMQRKAMSSSNIKMPSMPSMPSIPKM